MKRFDIDFTVKIEVADIAVAGEIAKLLQDAIERVFQDIETKHVETETRIWEQT